MPAALACRPSQPSQPAPALGAASPSLGAAAGPKPHQPTGHPNRPTWRCRSFSRRCWRSRSLLSALAASRAALRSARSALALQVGYRREDRLILEGQARWIIGRAVLHMWGRLGELQAAELPPVNLNKTGRQARPTLAMPSSQHCQHPSQLHILCLGRLGFTSAYSLLGPLPVGPLPLSLLPQLLLPPQLRLLLPLTLDAGLQ